MRLFLKCVGRDSVLISGSAEIICAPRGEQPIAADIPIDEGAVEHSQRMLGVKGVSSCTEHTKAYLRAQPYRPFRAAAFPPSPALVFVGLDGATPRPG